MLNDQDIEKIGALLQPKFDALRNEISESSTALQNEIKETSTALETRLTKNFNESIETLARITKNGFDEFHEFKEEMLSFKEDSETFQKNITHSITDLDDKVERVDTRLKNVETSITPLASEHKVIKKEVQHLNLRMDQVEEKLGIVT